MLSPAERARTIIATASTLRVASPELTLDIHRHGVVPDGSILFQAPVPTVNNSALRSSVSTGSPPPQWTSPPSRRRTACAARSP